MRFLEKHASVVAVLFSSIMIFAALAGIRSIGTSPFDISFFSFTQRVESPVITDSMIFITDLLSPVILGFLSLCMTGYFVYRKKYIWSVFFFATIACALLSVLILKDIFQIARPVDQIIPEVGWGFPSGHATAAAVFFFMYLYEVKQSIHTRAVLALWFAVAFLLLLSVGVSRVYLGVHFATDVLAGFALGTFWSMIGILLYERKNSYVRT